MRRRNDGTTTDQTATSLSATDSDIVPSTDNKYNLGLASKRFKSINVVSVNQIPASALLQNPTGAIAGGSIPVFTDNSGTTLQDSKVQAASVVTNTSPGATTGSVPFFVDNTGFKIASSGHSLGEFAALNGATFTGDLKVGSSTLSATGSSIIKRSTLYSTPVFTATLRPLQSSSTEVKISWTDSTFSLYTDFIYNGLATASWTFNGLPTFGKISFRAMVELLSTDGFNDGDQQSWKIRINGTQVAGVPTRLPISVSSEVTAQVLIDFKGQLQTNDVITVTFSNSSSPATPTIRGCALHFDAC